MVVEGSCLIGQTQYHRGKRTVSMGILCTQLHTQKRLLQAQRVFLPKRLVFLPKLGRARTTRGQPPIQPMPTSCNPPPIVQACRAAAHRIPNLTSLGNQARHPHR
jgi:hypothetical protein